MGGVVCHAHFLNSDSTWLFWCRVLKLKMEDNPASFSAQSEGELPECTPAAGSSSGVSAEAKGSAPGAVGGSGGKKAPAGKARRKLKRLKNEPKSVVGELGCLLSCVYTFFFCLGAEGKTRRGEVLSW